MPGEISSRNGHAGLFRPAALRAAGFRLFGDVCIALPPAATLCAAVGATLISLLAAAMWFVEVPVRIVATGMLMPPGGPLNVVAPDTGQVGALYVQEGQRVHVDDVLLEVAAHGPETNTGRNAKAELQSLREEYQLLDEVIGQQRAVFDERRTRLVDELKLAQSRVAYRERQVADHEAKLAVIAARLSRLRELSAAGHVSRDSVDVESLGLADARSAAMSAKAAMIESQSQLRNLQSRETEMDLEFDLVVAEYLLRQKQLLRQISKREILAVHDVIAPRDGTVAQISVTSGSSVSKGQVVAKLLETDASPHAWMYVSSARARQMRVGETVELQMDAWPASQFGTLEARVESVSGFVLRPADVPAPIPITEPVYEIRASLGDKNAIGIKPNPGAAFTAQIISRRYRLYQWLTRHLYNATSSTNA